MDTQKLHEFNAKMGAAQDTAIYLVGKLSGCKNSSEQRCVIEESERHLGTHGFLLISALLHVASYEYTKKGPDAQKNIRKACATLNRALTEKLSGISS